MNWWLVKACVLRRFLKKDSICKVGTTTALDRWRCKLWLDTLYGVKLQDIHGIVGAYR